MRAAVATTLVLLSAALSGCAAFAPPDDWTRKDTRRELYYVAALAADSYTTAQISRHPHLREANPFVAAVIGERPEPDEVWKGAVVTGLLHYWLARRIKKLRAAWQFAPVILHGDAALGNCGLIESCATEAGR